MYARNRLCATLHTYELWPHFWIGLKALSLYYNIFTYTALGLFYWHNNRLNLLEIDFLAYGVMLLSCGTCSDTRFSTENKHLCLNCFLTKLLSKRRGTAFSILFTDMRWNERKLGLIIQKARRRRSCCFVYVQIFTSFPQNRIQLTRYGESKLF